ncbi:MAG: CHASE2 domain-containing protein [bacterium]
MSAIWPERKSRLIVFSVLAGLFVIIALRSLLWSGIMALDPLGAVTSGAQASADVFWKLRAPFHPTAMQDKVVVILLNQEQMPLFEPEIDEAGITRQAAEAWPPRFFEYARILEVVKGPADERPRAVFFDLILDNEHIDDDTLGVLDAALKQAHADGLPVFLAKVPSRSAGPRSVRTTLETRPGRPLVLDENQPHIKPLAVAWDGYGDTYPLAVHSETKEGMKADELLTPASQLYLSFLESEETPANERRARKMRDHIATPREGFPPAMAVAWGMSAGQTPFDQHREGKNPCRPVGPDTLDRVGLSLRILWSAVGFGPARSLWEVPQPCPFHVSITAEELLSDDFSDQVMVRQLLDDAIVLIGADVQAIPDRVASPVQGTVPGVFLHAMALDNLLNFGTAHYRSPDKIEADFLPGWMRLSADRVIEGLLLVVAFAIAAFAERTGPAAHTFGGSIRSALRRLAFLAAFLVIVSAVLAWMTMSKNWVPYNWASILGISALIFFVNAQKMSAGFASSAQRTFAGHPLASGLVLGAIMCLAATVLILLAPSILLGAALVLPVLLLLFSLWRREAAITP